MKNRPARVRELIQRELGMLIAREMTFDAKLVTVQSVDLTADFKHCHVHVGVLGTERERLDAIHKLAEVRPMLQHELSRHVILKYTPRLHFHLDTAVERGTKIMEIMRQIDEVTPPESAEDAARRTDAFADGDVEAITGFDDEDAEAPDEEETPFPAPGPEKVRGEPRSLRGRGSRQEGNALDDDE